MGSLALTLLGLVLLDHALEHRLRVSKGKWPVLAAGVGAWVLAVALVPNRYVFQKIVAGLVMPAGLIWAVLFGLAAVAARRRDGWAWAWLTVWGLYGAAGSPWLGSVLLYQLEAPYRSVDPLTEPADVVVVLGGGTTLGPTRSQAGPAGDRVLLAAERMRRGRTQRLITTGSSIPDLGQPRDLTQETLEIWQNLGIDPDRVVRLSQPKNTSEEMEAVAAWCRSHGVTQVGLLTSAWHLPRATALASRAGLDVVPLPADFRVSVPPRKAWPGPLDLIPSGGGFQDVHRACWEFLGRWVGR